MRNEGVISFLASSKDSSYNSYVRRTDHMLKTFLTRHSELTKTLLAVFFIAGSLIFAPTTYAEDSNCSAPFELMCNGNREIGGVVVPGSNQCKCVNGRGRCGGPGQVGCNLVGLFPELRYFCQQGLPKINIKNTIYCVATEDEAKEAEKNEKLTNPAFNLCTQAGVASEVEKCMACVGDPLQPSKIWTAVGCIPTDSQGILVAFVQLGLGVGGGVVLISVLGASFMLTTSQGDPNKTKQAQEIYTSAFAGLLFIIFSMVTLSMIGVNILQIPGF